MKILYIRQVFPYNLFPFAASSCFHSHLAKRIPNALCNFRRLSLLLYIAKYCQVSLDKSQWNCNKCGNSCTISVQKVFIGGWIFLIIKFKDISHCLLYTVCSHITSLRASITILQPVATCTVMIVRVWKWWKHNKNGSVF